MSSPLLAALSNRLRIAPRRQPVRPSGGGGRNQPFRVFRWIAVAGLVALFSSSPQRCQQSAEPPTVVVAQMLEIRHRRADALLARGQVADAIALLERTAKELPESSDPTLTILRHDAYGRLLELRSRYPSVDPRAPRMLLDLADRGLGPQFESVAPNPFTARLIALRAEVLEQLGRDDEALAAYDQALRMHELLLQRFAAEDLP